MDKQEIINIIGNTTIPLTNLKDKFNIDDYVNIKDYLKYLENKGAKTVISYGVNVRLSSDDKDTILPYNYNNADNFDAREVAKQVSDGYKIPDFMTNLVNNSCKDVFFRADYSKIGEEVIIKKIDIRKITTTNHMVFDNRNDFLYKSAKTEDVNFYNILCIHNNFFSTKQKIQKKDKTNTFLHENIRGLYPDDTADETIYVWVRGEDPDISASVSNNDYLTIIFAISNNFDIIDNIRRNSLDSILEFVMLLKSRRTLDFNIKQNRESIKSAKAAIMSRNMSHNLGSHVMFYIKQKLESVNTILSEGALLDLVKATSVEELNSKVDGKSIGDGKEIYFLVGLGRFINYLQERQDYIATISTNHVPYKSTVNFKDAIYDELKPELKSQRHKDDRSIDGKHAANLLLDYIAYSEGFHPSNRIELWYEDFNGTGTPHDVPPELRNFNIDLPGGTLGRQAFFSIMENIIRNTAKHEGSGMSGRNLIFIFKQLTEVDQLRFWTNEKNYPQQASETKKIYDAEKNRSNYCYLGITVDLGVEVPPDAITKIKNGLNEAYLNENGSMNDNGKGIKEIRISAAWMRGFWIDDAIPVDEPPAVAIRTDNGRLQYVICLPKPKRVAFVTTKDTELDNNGCRHFDSKWIEQNNDKKIEKKRKEIADFDLIVCPDSLYGTIQKHAGSRILHIPDVMDYTNKSISDLYHDWLEQQFNKEYPSGQLPTLVINDQKAFENKHESKKEDNPSGQQPSDEKASENKQKNEKWRDDAQSMIDGKKVECNSSDTVSDQIVFAKHYNWSKEGKELRKDFYYNAKFLEGISGGNSTDRLIRYDTWDEEWYVKHMAAALTHVAIIDERIYNTFVKKEQDWNEEKLKEWLQKYNPELSSCPNPDLFLLDCFRDEFSIEVSEENVNTLLIYRDNGWTTTKDHQTLKNFIDNNLRDNNGSIIDYSSAQLFAQKGVCAFNIITDVNKVIIKGYSPKRKEECELAMIILEYDNNSKKYRINTECEEEFLKKFHFVSIHQGVLEKMYESLMKKDDKGENNGITKSDITKAVFDIFSMKEAVGNDFLPQFVIHSGRSKPSSDDMPQRQPFIQFAALDNAIHDCKYTLTELLYSAHYES